MAIKFVPADQDVNVISGKDHEKRLEQLLNCVITKLDRLERQLEGITGESLDCDLDSFI